MPKRTAHIFEDKWRSDDVKLLEAADFSSLLLCEKVLLGLKKAGFKTPSPIQLEAIPVGRVGGDLLVQAKSGTGKTLVFTIIALELLLELKQPQVLILAPTREIAFQICDVVKSVGCTFPYLKCGAFIGGISIESDIQNIQGCQIVVGTPGRIKQLLSLNILKPSAIRILVLDEADQLLDKSFKPEIDSIFVSLHKELQIIATSATYPKALQKLLKRYFRLDPYVARLNVHDLALLGIVHYARIVEVSQMPVLANRMKMRALEEVLTCVNFSQCLVFCNAVSRVEAVCDDIKNWGFSATYISSAKEQAARLKAIECLKRFKCKVLVSSDITSRGIDAENVDLIVSVDVPYSTEVYLHRVGRAGRFGSKGVAITFVSTNEMESFKKIQKYGNFKSYFLPDPVPANLINHKPGPEAESIEVEVSDLESSDEEPISLYNMPPDSSIKLNKVEHASNGTEDGAVPIESQVQHLNTLNFIDHSNEEDNKSQNGSPSPEFCTFKNYCKEESVDKAIKKFSDPTGRELNYSVKSLVQQLYADYTSDNSNEKNNKGQSGLLPPEFCQSENYCKDKLKDKLSEKLSRATNMELMQSMESLMQRLNAQLSTSNSNEKDIFKDYCKDESVDKPIKKFSKCTRMLLQLFIKSLEQELHSPYTTDNSNETDIFKDNKGQSGLHSPQFRTSKKSCKDELAGKLLKKLSGATDMELMQSMERLMQRLNAQLSTGNLNEKDIFKDQNGLLSTEFCTSKNCCKDESVDKPIKNFSKCTRMILQVYKRSLEQQLNMADESLEKFSGAINVEFKPSMESLMQRLDVHLSINNLNEKDIFKDQKVQIGSQSPEFYMPENYCKDEPTNKSLEMFSGDTKKEFAQSTTNESLIISPCESLLQCLNTLNSLDSSNKNSVNYNNDIIGSANSCATDEPCTDEWFIENNLDKDIIYLQSVKSSGKSEIEGAPENSQDDIETNETAIPLAASNESEKRDQTPIDVNENSNEIFIKNALNIVSKTSNPSVVDEYEKKNDGKDKAVEASSSPVTSKMGKISMEVDELSVCCRKYIDECEKKNDGKDKAVEASGSPVTSNMVKNPMEVDELSVCYRTYIDEYVKKNDGKDNAVLASGSPVTSNIVKNPMEVDKQSVCCRKYVDEYEKNNDEKDKTVETSGSPVTSNMVKNPMEVDEVTVCVMKFIDEYEKKNTNIFNGDTISEKPIQATSSRAKCLTDELVSVRKSLNDYCYKVFQAYRNDNISGDPAEIWELIKSLNVISHVENDEKCSVIETKEDMIPVADKIDLSSWSMKLDNENLKGVGSDSTEESADSSSECILESTPVKVSKVKNMRLDVSSDTPSFLNPIDDPETDDSSGSKYSNKCLQLENGFRKKIGTVNKIPKDSSDTESSSSSESSHEESLLEKACRELAKTNCEKMTLTKKAHTLRMALLDLKSKARELSNGESDIQICTATDSSDVHVNDRASNDKCGSFTMLQHKTKESDAKSVSSLSSVSSPGSSMIAKKSARGRRSSIQSCSSGKSVNTFQGKYRQFSLSCQTSSEDSDTSVSHSDRSNRSEKQKKLKAAKGKIHSRAKKPPVQCNHAEGYTGANQSTCHSNNTQNRGRVDASYFNPQGGIEGSAHHTHNDFCYWPSQHQCHSLNSHSSCQSQACATWYDMFYSQWYYIQQSSCFQ